MSNIAPLNDPTNLSKPASTAGGEWLLSAKCRHPGRAKSSRQNEEKKYPSGNLREDQKWWREWPEENHLLEFSVRAQLDVGDVGHGSRRPLQQAPELRVRGHVMGASQVPNVGVEQEQGRLGSPVGTQSSCCTQTKRKMEKKSEFWHILLDIRQKLQSIFFGRPKGTRQIGFRRRRQKAQNGRGGKILQRSSGDGRRKSPPKAEWEFD